MANQMITLYWTLWCALLVGKGLVNLWGSLQLLYHCIYIAFTQLLTDLDEYTGDLTNISLPYFDFQTYMIKTVLSGLEDTVLSSKV